MITRPLANLSIWEEYVEGKKVWVVDIVQTSKAPLDRALNHIVRFPQLSHCIMLSVLYRNLSTPHPLISMLHQLLIFTYRMAKPGEPYNFDYRIFLNSLEYLACNQFRFDSPRYAYKYPMIQILTQGKRSTSFRSCKYTALRLSNKEEIG